MGPDFPPGARVGVLTAEPLDRVLDYKAPEEGCSPGDFVVVPLGPRKVLGVVWGAGESDFDPARLRAVDRVLDVPPMTAEMQAFLTRAAAYTLTPLSMMLRLATRVPDLGKPPADRRVYRRSGDAPSRMTPARRRVLEVLEEMGGAALSLGELSATAGVSTSVVKGLVAAGTVLEEAAPRDLPFPPLDPELPGKPLTADQAAAAAILRQAIAAGGYGTTLLKGVTGSGKTEVYLEAAAAALAKGRQVLVLLPEIALSQEFLDRVEARFGARPAEWHSGVTQAERRRTWTMVAAGRAQLVVGARSALFLPFRDLGLIVVDEEHDSAYKQEEVALYNARDMAVLRASIVEAQVVLVSATPSLETWANADGGKYRRLDLTARFGAAELPDMATLDMRTDPPERGQWISPPLAGAVTQTLGEGGQVLLFLNRRGYAPVTLCRACGEQIACDQCDARMVEHRFRARLVCHQCGADRAIPAACPSCGKEDTLAAVGPGVERLAEEAAARFPGARLAVLSSDLFASARALKAQIAEIAEGGADLIIGTQLVAKGHNFPGLRLVGVVDADLGLQGSDLRAAERTFQLLRQVAGRAGRTDARGRALIQTFQPDHPVLRAILSGEDEAFWRAEARAREAAGMPPYSRLAALILSGPKFDPVMEHGQALVRAAAPVVTTGAQVLGPALAPIARIRNQHRVRLLVRAPRAAPLQAALARWLADNPPPSGVRVAVDIDPQSFL